MSSAIADNSKSLVEDEPCQEVHQDVEKRKQSEHAAKSYEPVPVGDKPQGRNRECDQDESKAPVAKAVLNFLNRVRAQVAGDCKQVTDDRANGTRLTMKTRGFQIESNLTDSVHERQKFLRRSNPS